MRAIVLNRYFPFWKLLFLSSIFKTAVAQKLCDGFDEICNVYIGKMIIKAAKRAFNSDKICRSYRDLNFGDTFLEHSVYYNTFCAVYKYSHLLTYLLTFAWAPLRGMRG